MNSTFLLGRLCIKFYHKQPRDKTRKLSPGPIFIHFSLPSQQKAAFDAIASESFKFGKTALSSFSLFQISISVRIPAITNSKAIYHLPHSPTQ
jgi:hypothetical protein